MLLADVDEFACGRQRACQMLTRCEPFGNEAKLHTKNDRQVEPVLPLESRIVGCQNRNLSHIGHVADDCDVPRKGALVLSHNGWKELQG
jgi:hypothetical protein